VAKGGGGNVLEQSSEGSDGWYSSHGSQKMMGGGQTIKGSTVISAQPARTYDPADAGQYGNIRPASGDYGDPADDRRNTW